MPVHEEYQEICAAASIGQAAPEEIARLSEHLLGCGACRRAYSEFTNIAAQQYVHDLSRKGIPPEEDRQLPDSDLLRRRFLQRAAERGILSSGREGKHVSTGPSSAFSGSWIPLLPRLTWKGSIGAVLALTAVVASILFAHGVGRRMSSKASFAGVTQSPKLSRDTAAIATGAAYLTALNAELEAQVARLKKDLTKNQEQLRAVRETLDSTVDDKQNVEAERKRQEATVGELQKRLAEAETLLQSVKDEQAKLQEEATKLRNEAAAAQATYIADQIRIRELNEALSANIVASERDGQLLQRDRDIRDLMTARNLHIFDVFDTDAKGKTKPAFGRIFYTEGKSLIFYAYDLNEAKVQNANYHYRVWGSQEAQKDKVTSLGVFYSDDKSQRRWVFKCDDPKILRQIDSVFVTLEPPGTTSAHPKGEKLLDAYLGGVANHP